MDERYRWTAVGPVEPLRTILWLRNQTDLNLKESKRAYDAVKDGEPVVLQLDQLALEGLRRHGCVLARDVESQG